MTADPDGPMWRGDAALLVYAVRYALTRPASVSAAATVTLRSLQVNRGSLPANVQQVIARDLTTWLEGPGADEPGPNREPWVLALAVLGVRRKPAVRTETPR